MEGTVVLDSLSVDKVLSRFQFSLVKFDTFYPTGDKHLNFAKIAQAVSYHTTKFYYIQWWATYCYKLSALL
jgi:hypothetical protein